MKRPILLLLFTLVLVLQAHAQQIILTGQVSIHNSRYRSGQTEYVKGAYATAPFAKPDDTDDNGMFYLEFVGMGGDTSVKVQVGKAELEVVNARDLLDVVIGRETLLRVFLAPPGQLAKVQAELYDVSLKVLTTKHTTLVAALRQAGDSREAALKELRQNIDREFGNWYEAEEYLNKQMESVKARLPETVKQLAAVNLDFASARYIRAYQHYEKGEIAQAITLLDAARLDEDARQANTQLAGIAKELNYYKADRELAQERVSQIVRSYQLKAQAYRILFRYREAAQVYEKAIALMEKTKWAVDLEFAMAYDEIGTIYQEFGVYKAALVYRQKSVNICDGLLEEDAPELARAYNNLVSVLKDLGDYHGVKSLLEKAVKSAEQDLGPSHPTTASRYNDLALALQDLGDYPGAKSLLEKVMKSDEQNFGPDHPNTAVSYSNLATVLKNLGDYYRAKLLLEKAIKSNMQNFGPDHPKTAVTYWNLASVYMDLKEYDKARSLLEKAQQVFFSQLGANHPDSKGVKSWMAKLDALAIYSPAAVNQAPYYQAAEYQRLAIGNLQKALPYLEPAELYNFIGLCHYYLKEYAQALENYEQSHQLDPFNEGVYLSNTGLAYAKSGNLEEAKRRFEQLQALLPNQGLPYRDWSVYYALKGDTEQALVNLEKAVQFGYNDLKWIKTEESLEELREEDRYKAIVKQLTPRSIAPSSQSSAFSWTSVSTPNANFRQASTTTKDCISVFPWPPPKPSARHEIPNDFFSGAKTLGDINSILYSALDQCGYFERSNYCVLPDGGGKGFALVARMEQINEEAFSLPLPDRWSIELKSLSSFSFIEVLKSLFLEKPGYFRIVAFVVCDKPFTSSSITLTQSKGIDLVDGGANRPSSEIAAIPLSTDYSCTALIYEFEVPESGREPRLVQNSRHTGRVHLERAKLLGALQIKK